MERDQPYLDMSGHPPNPNQSAPRSGQNILGAPFIAQPSSTGIQCLDTDTAPSLDLASIGLQDLQINQHVNGVQSASGFSDAHMNEQYTGHPQPVDGSENPTSNYGMQGPIMRAGESATALSRPNNSRNNTMTEPRDAKEVLEGKLRSRNDDPMIGQYRSTIRLLLGNNISYEMMLQVVNQAGLSCLLSRSNFFRILDNGSHIGEVSYATSPPTSLTDNYNTAQNTLSSLSPRESIDSSIGGPKHPNYDSREKRYGSYVDWTYQHQSPNKLCEAGLFAAGKGKGDKCVCFNCGVSIINWEANDDPLVEHYKLSKQQNKHCSFVIQEMAEKHFNLVNNSGQTSPVEDQIKHHKRCGVCGARQIAVSQFSCGHIVCVRCAPVPGENRVCKMCGDKVVKTSAYDPAALDG